MPKISVQRVVEQKFKPIRYITFLTPEEEQAVIKMMTACMDTLITRGNTRTTQKGAAEAQRAWDLVRQKVNDSKNK